METLELVVAIADLATSFTAEASLVKFISDCPLGASLVAETTEVVLLRHILPALSTLAYRVSALRTWRPAVKTDAVYCRLTSPAPPNALVVL